MTQTKTGLPFYLLSLSNMLDLIRLTSVHSSSLLYFDIPNEYLKVIISSSALEKYENISYINPYGSVSSIISLMKSARYFHFAGKWVSRLSRVSKRGGGGPERRDSREGGGNLGEEKSYSLVFVKENGVFAVE